MQSFIAKPVTPASVQAVQYVAPDGADERGNLTELADAGLQFRGQTPWNPAGGQHAVLVATPAGDKLVTSGDYVIVNADETIDVLDEESFHAAYDATNAPDVSTLGHSVSFDS